MDPGSGQFTVIGVIRNANLQAVEGVTVSVYLAWVDTSSNYVQRRVDSTSDASGGFQAIYTIPLGSNVFSCFANAFDPVSKEKGWAFATTPGTNWADPYTLDMSRITIR